MVLQSHLVTDGQLGVLLIICRPTQGFLDSGLTKVFAIFRKEDFSRAKVKPASNRIVCGELWTVCFSPPIALLKLSPVISVVSIRPG